MAISLNTDAPSFVSKQKTTIGLPTDVLLYIFRFNLEYWLQPHRYSLNKNLLKANENFTSRAEFKQFMAARKAANFFFKETCYTYTSLDEDLSLYRDFYHSKVFQDYKYSFNALTSACQAQINFVYTKHFAFFHILFPDPNSSCYAREWCYLEEIETYHQERKNLLTQKMQKCEAEIARLKADITEMQGEIDRKECSGQRENKLKETIKKFKLHLEDKMQEMNTLDQKARLNWGDLKGFFANHDGIFYDLRVMSTGCDADLNRREKIANYFCFFKTRQNGQEKTPANASAPIHFAKNRRKRK